MKFADQYLGVEEAAVLAGQSQFIATRPDFDHYEMRTIWRTEPGNIIPSEPTLLAMPKRKPCGGCGATTGFFANHVCIRTDPGQPLLMSGAYVCSDDCLRKLQMEIL